MSRAARHRGDTPPPEHLLGLLTSLPDHLVVGFDHRRDHIDVFTHPYPEDVRSGAAGLFSFVAPTSWCAVGITVRCTARDAVSGTVIGGDAILRVLVTRSGQVVSRTWVEGMPIEPDDAFLDGGLFDTTDLLHDPSGRSQGPVVDALHRVLGLRCPGEPPELTTLALVVWLHDVLEHALQRGEVKWAEAVAMHPGDPGPSHVGPSTETLVEALLRSAADSDWERMRRRLASSGCSAGQLTADEARWMDRTLFGRWTLSALPDVDTMLMALRAIGCADVADRFAQVMDLMTEEVSRARRSDRPFPRTA